MFQTIPEQKLIKFFSTLRRWAVVRNGDLLGNLRRGGDCDILVSDLQAAEALLISILGPPLHVAFRSYVKGYYYEWGYIDFFTDYQWRGVLLLEGEDVLTHSKINSFGWPVLFEEEEACVMLLTSLLWGGFVKMRYWNHILEVWAHQQEYMEGAMIKMLGKPSAKILVGGLSQKSPGILEKRATQLRILLAVREIMRHPFLYPVRYFNFVKAEIALRISPPIPIIVICGLSKVQYNEMAREIQSNSTSFWRTPVRHFRLAAFPRASIFRKIFFIFLKLRFISFRARSGLVLLSTETSSETSKRSGFGNCVEVLPIRDSTTPFPRDKISSALCSIVRSKTSQRISRRRSSAHKAAIRGGNRPSKSA